MVIRISKITDLLHPSEKILWHRQPKITDLLLPTEKILWHRQPEAKPKTQRKKRPNLIPILSGVILVISLVLLLLTEIYPTNFTFFIILITIALILIGIGLIPLISYTTSKDIEYLITNKRVLIYPSPYSKGVGIINLYEVNGDIEMKYYKASDTGDIYIPSPHWNRSVGVVQSRTIINNKSIIDPDIKGIKDPYKVYNILIEAIETRKSINWK